MHNLQLLISVNFSQIKVHFVVDFQKHCRTVFMLLVIVMKRACKSKLSTTTTETKHLPVKSVSKGELSSGNSGSPVMLMKAITTLTDVASRPPPSLASTVTCGGGGGKIEPLEILKPDFWISGHARHRMSRRISTHGGLGVVN